ncbi:tRNA sulfurtransferase [Zhongshania aliphaticivorans]|uniref:tRNA sulfurtransferase n=1 Tax=Zhongshania aliphaticivorans TaxID=1470434 RepID=A0A5S9MPC0_9GAMM|nr:tRNA uracil 4-sulfurtransferase ThiI [Zhongshania aliphaticivorans]CAA0078688.1 tRNA sulfurtransferase [Zhongshania aliphaticivorans]CAA0086570.1 tRNA sulfurtransferase [Zhongshania aliphaticivorans]
MKFIVKLFPEIIIKSKPVRKKFTQQLRDNLRKLLLPLDPDLTIIRDWDRITLETRSTDPLVLQGFVVVLSQTPGIAHAIEVAEYPLVDVHDIYEKTREAVGDSLRGKRFVVRCKRVGQHDFNSGEVERYVGGGLNQHVESAGVDLRNPDVTVRIEVRNQQVYIVNRRIEGLGGFPLGTVDAVMSLISGGFDSTVSSYMTMKRGMRTHFCFFNLGGREHEVGVKEVALYLWLKYGASHRVKFVSVPFEDVVAEILKNVENSQMGVILKRMMLRAASQVAAQLEVPALVTGEAVAQVSSQTLQNLSVIDQATDTLVLRPLITMDKLDIIKTAAAIGTEEFAANMPEYCGVISVKPTTKAKPEKIAAQEANFDFAVLERAIAAADFINIDQLADEDKTVAEVEVLPIPLPDSVILDVRHPDEVDRKPLKVTSGEVQAVPFFELHRRFAELDQSRIYLLYCDKGVMSRLHASHLIEQGFSNVKVYRPS